MMIISFNILFVSPEVGALLKSYIRIMIIFLRRFHFCKITGCFITYFSNMLPVTYFDFFFVVKYPFSKAKIRFTSIKMHTVHKEFSVVVAKHQMRLSAFMTSHINDKPSFSLLNGIIKFSIIDNLKSIHLFRIS